MKNINKKYRLAALVLIVIAVIGFFGTLEDTSSSGPKRNSSGSYSYSDNSYGYSYSGSSYNYTCYKCLNKGYHKCTVCSGKGYTTEYYSTPNYSGTGSSPSTAIKTNCYNCDNGIQDCRHCYN